MVNLASPLVWQHASDREKFDWMLEGLEPFEVSDVNQIIFGYVYMHPENSDTPSNLFQTVRYFVASPEYPRLYAFLTRNATDYKRGDEYL